MTDKHRIFCGGAFCFDYRDEKYELEAANDYRADILGGVTPFLRPNRSKEIKIAPNIVYVGPYYFEAESMEAKDIIKCEKEMIESCTDAIFLLDEANCPGTIAEIIYANTLKKHLHLFYVRHPDDEETESTLHTPCWYPILLCQMTNSNANICPCPNFENAKQKAIELIQSMRHDT